MPHELIERPPVPEANPLPAQLQLNKGNEEKKEEKPFIRNRPERGLNDFPLFPIYNNYQSTGVLFSDLDPVPFDSQVDACPHSCFNRRQKRLVTYLVSILIQ